MEITKEQVLSFLSENKEVINEVLTATHIENYLSNQEGQKLFCFHVSKPLLKYLSSLGCINF